MKKVTKILACLAMCFSFTGCFASIYTRKGGNDIESVCSNCLNVDNIKSLSTNVQNVMRKVNALEGSYTLTNTKDTYNLTFDILVKEKREDWDLYAQTYFKEKNITVYLKDEKFYVIYPNNGANIIMKDTLDNVSEEIRKTLDKLNASYDRENLEDILTGDRLEGFDFETIEKNGTYVKHQDGTYTITFNKEDTEWQYDIASNYLITQVRGKADNYTSSLSFTYPENLSITYPMGLDFLTVNVEEIKEILDVETLAEIIDEDLKENTKEQE